MGIAPPASVAPDEGEPPSDPPLDRNALYHEAIRFVRAYLMEREVKWWDAETVALREAADLLEGLGKPGGYDPGRPLPPYLSKRARERYENERISREAEDTRAVLYQHDLENAQRDWMNPEARVNDSEMKEMYYRALKTVPAACREVYILKEHKQLSDEQIARLTGMKKEAVRVYVHRARVHLANNETLYSYAKEER